MLLHHHGPNGSRDVEVDVSDSDATIADLAAALDPAAPSPHLTVDGRIVPPTVPLDRAPIGRGSTISTVTVADATTPTAAVDAGACSAVLSDRPVVAVSVIRGLDAGRSWLLPTGTFVLGRKARFPAAGRRDDPQHLWTSDRTVSGSQVELRVHGSTAVEVTDLGSENGTWLGDRRLRGKDRWRAGVEMRCGAAVLRLEPVRHPSAQPIALGAPPWPWHRRPTGVGVDPAPSGRGLLVPPDDVEPTPVVTPVGVFAVVASAAVGAVMVLVLGSWTYAAFALLGPLTMVAGSLDGRIRRRRTRRRGGRARRIALEQFVEALRSRREADLTELDAAHPGVHTAVEASGARLGCLHDVPAAALWSRRRDDPVAPLLRLGTGPTSWTPPVTGEVHGWAADVTDAVDGFRTMDSSPVVLDVRRGPLAIVGPPEACRAVLRSLLIQATTLRGPADLRVGGILDPDTADDWAWMRWLPHASDPTVGDLLTAGGTRAGRIVDLATSHPQTTDRDGRLPPDLIVVVEDEKGLRATRGASRSLLRLAESRPSVCPILLLRSRAEAPQTCTIVEVGADGTLTGPPWLLAGTGVAEGTAADVASAAARSMGRFLDPEADDPGAGLPGSVPLLDLLGGAELNAEGIAARWRATGVHPAPLATLGRTAVGPLTVDLASDGPHALIAGT
ncbi:MAG: FHA domain-containing protein, partial [Acidimicrobiales bacterium]|nr:FHA domain-containing protein [Acidimicrobiales bacterium]